MIRLRPYKACDAQTITNWIKDEYAFRQWSADRYEKYPITPADMNLYYDRDKDNERIWGMTAFDDIGIVGHFTMRFPDKSSFDEIRLGFVIVDNKRRGKGYGKEMLSLAIQYAFDFVKVGKISLGVFENNKIAIKCYESCGFILTNVKIFQFPHGTCCIIGQHAPCGKENLIVSEYKRVELENTESYHCMGEVWDCIEMELRL